MDQNYKIQAMYFLTMSVQTCTHVYVGHTSLHFVHIWMMYVVHVHTQTYLMQRTSSLVPRPHQAFNHGLEKSEVGLVNFVPPFFVTMYIRHTLYVPELISV